ncbi:N-acetyltransferase [Anoxybacillus flavithermus]|uniref:N-acetyltransferase n=1 Tax=Anoxybacillus flavithermus TaxID=33934 RepID=A0A2G5RP51_9BACL|nr:MULTISPECIES: GNAT family N-acetyltransferase [Anoxybacillus]KFZ43124.1 GNAT family acetyltransferase [Anoxybacillus sp. KU2-6(11)]PIC04486.1 N-acetyltransferase [Anoxybacillus flavithermus]
MAYVIRKMKQEDIKQIQYIAKITWNVTYEGIIPSDVQENFLKSAYSDERMKQRLDRSILFVAEMDEKIVGFANFSPIGKDGSVELWALYVHPKQQGKGIGSALLQKGIQIDGVNEIYVNVEKDNQIGKTFYEAKGFEVVKEFVEEFDGHTLKTIRMVLKLKKSHIQNSAC